MADIWTTPLTWTAGNQSVANLNQYIRDNMDALKAGLVGDASADADIFQAIKFGTLAARPAGTVATAGRQYYATDRGTTYIVDAAGTWQILTGAIYDSFNRANSTTLGTSESGHVWAENTGDQEILSLAVHGLSAGVCTVDAGGILTSARFTGQMTTHTTQASIDFGIVLRYVDASNFLYAQMAASVSAWRLVKRVAGVDTPLSSVTVVPTANLTHVYDITMIGSLIIGNIYAPVTGAGNNTWGLDTPADTLTPFATATRCGLRIQTTGANSDVALSYAVKF